jgi:hypothetical protein
MPGNEKERIERVFQEMQEVLESSAPGVNALLRVYGGYEAALRQAQLYLGVLNTRAVFLTTDKSSL